jgi:nitroreductase
VADAGADPCREAFRISGAGDALKLDSGSNDLGPGAASGADLAAAGDAIANDGRFGRQGHQLHIHAQIAARTGGWLDKLRLVVTRYGLPTSNAGMAKPYVAELRPRAQRVGKELYAMLGVERGDAKGRDAQWARNYEFFGAPVELFIFVHKSLGIYAASDAGLMMQALSLSAHAHGLGVCAQGAVGIWDDVVRDEFDVPREYRLLCGVAIGYPTDAQVNTFQAHRLGVDEVTLPVKRNR